VLLIEFSTGAISERQ